MHSLLRIELAVIGLFILMKLSRKTVLAMTDNELIRVIFFSFPNLAEGIVGVLVLTILLLGFLRIGIKVLSPKDTVVYIIAVLGAAVYVLSQEFKLHNLGGKNIFDVNDVYFSLIGLLLGAFILYCIQPSIAIPTDENG